jgi:hypothetical protein
MKLLWHHRRTASKNEDVIDVTSTFLEARIPHAPTALRTKRRRPPPQAAILLGAAR